MLSRKVVTRRGRGIRGYFPSRKLGRMVAWESPNERDAILFLEFSRGVISYQEQPTVVLYFDGNQIRKYYPDFEAVLVDCRRLHIEVKSSAQLAKPKVAQKLQAISAHYLRQGEEFRILTEKELRREPLRANVLALINAQRHPTSLLPTQAELIRNIGSEFPLKSVEDRYGREAALRMIALGTLECDLNQPLVSDMTIKVGKGGDDATLLF